MFQKILQAKKIQQIACVSLVAMMWIGLFSVGAFATELYEISDTLSDYMSHSEEDFDQNASSNQSIIPFGTVIGHVGPNATFAPWWWQNGDPSAGVVEVGGGVVQGAAASGFYADYSPWDAHRLQVERIVFTDPDNTIGSFNLTSLFRNLPNLTEIENIDYINIGNSRWLSNIFRDASSLENIIGLENWDTSGVLRFTGMFRGTSFATLDLSTFDVSSALRLDSMFRGTSNLTEIIGLDSWDTGNVQTMGWMFEGASGFTTLDLSTLDTGRVTTFEGMFQNAGSLERIIGIEDFDISSALTIAHMFRGANSLTSVDLSAWNTSGMTGAVGGGMASAFRDMNSLTSLDLSGWDTRNASDAQMAQMFANATALTLKELTLGEHWAVPTGGVGPNLPTVPSDFPFTGTWQNVADGTIYNPQGTLFYTSSDLMSGNSGAANTWVWTRELLEVIFVLNGGSVNGITYDISCEIPAGNPITSAQVPVPIHSGWDFLGWMEYDFSPLLSRADVGALIVTAPRTFTAQWGLSNNPNPNQIVQGAPRASVFSGADIGFHARNENETHEHNNPPMGRLAPGVFGSASLGSSISWIIIPAIIVLAALLSGFINRKG